MMMNRSVTVTEHVYMDPEPGSWTLLRRQGDPRLMVFKPWLQ